MRLGVEITVIAIDLHGESALSDGECRGAIDGIITSFTVINTHLSFADINIVHVHDFVFRRGNRRLAVLYRHLWLFRCAVVFVTRLTQDDGGILHNLRRNLEVGRSRCTFVVGRLGDNSSDSVAAHIGGNRRRVGLVVCILHLIDKAQVSIGRYSRHARDSRCGTIHPAADADGQFQRCLLNREGGGSRASNTVLERQGNGSRTGIDIVSIGHDVVSCGYHDVVDFDRHFGLLRCTVVGIAPHAQGDDGFRHVKRHNLEVGCSRCTFVVLGLSNGSADSVAAHSGRNRL